MKRLFAIDTSSLVNFARYYVPFDKEGAAASRLKELFDDQTLILLQSVQRECTGVAGGVVTKTLPFLSGFKSVKKKIELEDIGHGMIDDRWRVKNLRNPLQGREYSVAKEEFIATADAQLVLYALSRSEDLFSRIVIVTEENKASNDGKPFKKIPLICEGENIPCITLPEMLKEVGILWRPEIQLTATGDGYE